MRFTHIHIIQIFVYFDCINKVDSLIKRAYEIGLSGIALTDHETLSGAVDAKNCEEKIQKENPDFKVALGNEIYLTETRDSNQTYYHFILIAKNKLGYRMLREMSSISWMNSYTDRGMERVPTLKSELENMIKKHGKGNLIATTACLGGELSSLTWDLIVKEQTNSNNVNNIKLEIHNFMTWCKELFGNDFYVECAPGLSEQQIAVNNRLVAIAKAYDVKMVIGTDAHFLSKEDRFVHKAYLNSKDGEREVDDFYEFSYLQTEDEIRQNLKLDYDELVKNSEEIYQKIENYSIKHAQQIPTVQVTDYPKKDLKDLIDYPVLKSLFNSDDKQDRYWVNQCFESLEKKKGSWKDNLKYVARLEEEADIKTTIGNILGTNMLSYPITLQHYIDMMWDSGSTIGAGRGSACSGLNHYLLGVTQLDPVQWDLPFWRYLNKDRVELPDIDLDLCPSKRPAIINKIKAERGGNFLPEIDDLSRKHLGCTLIATFGTEQPKAAVQTACRGYRSEEYPNGIDVDQAQYMASLIPQERGFLWTLEEVIYGNKEKDRKPVQTFINEINNYPGLLEIALGIQGLVKQRGSHASGVILFNEDPYEFGAFMKTPSGDIITQFDLHADEALGMTKFDFLVTDVQDKIVETINLLKKDGVFDEDMSLREIYNKYLHPDVLPLEDRKIWKALEDGSVLNIFQFDSLVGAQAAKKIKPESIMEMSSANGLMRLMTGEKGEEQPMDKYIRFKNTPGAWQEEMRKDGLTPKEMKVFERHIGSTYGVGISQEQLMRALMDKDICEFPLKDANTARKIIGKKQMAQIPVLRKQIMDTAKSPAIGSYVWKSIVAPQLGYSFSDIHSLSYSFVGAQTIYLGTYYNPIYWNTACLIVNSGSLEDNSEEEIVDIYAPEGDDLVNGVTFIDLPDRKTKIRKTGSTNYGKTAKAIGDIMSAGIKVSLIDINKSQFGFSPDVEHNQILFGLKALLNVGDEVVEKIIENRPYNSPKDFLDRVKPSKQAMVSLIKSGAFDNMIDRKICMGWYLWETCDKKSRLTLQNMSSLVNYNLIPKETAEQNLAYRVYEFNRYLKEVCKSKQAGKYNLDERAINFIIELGVEDILSGTTLDSKVWDKRVYQKQMDVFRAWLNANKDEVLKELNKKIFQEDWNKYAAGNVSAWEMEVLCFYYHKHELAHVNRSLYGIKNFFNLPKEPVVEKSFTARGGHTVNIFQLNKICGTCIAKDKIKSIVTLLTPEGVVNVKFRKEYFALFDKQISERGSDGVKHVVERSWFNRGSMIMVQGVRMGDNFIPKKYASTVGHQLYRIERIDSEGSLILKDHRYKGGETDD